MTNNRIISLDSQTISQTSCQNINFSSSFITIKDVEDADLLQCNKGSMTPSSAQPKDKQVFDQ